MHVPSNRATHQLMSNGQGTAENTGFGFPPGNSAISPICDINPYTVPHQDAIIHDRRQG